MRQTQLTPKLLPYIQVIQNSPMFYILDMSTVGEGGPDEPNFKAHWVAFEGKKEVFKGPKKLERPTFDLVYRFDLDQMFIQFINNGDYQPIHGLKDFIKYINPEL